jgi:hypothetical protein
MSIFFLIGILPEIRANYAKIIKRKFFYTCRFAHLARVSARFDTHEVAHSRKAIYCYIVVLVAIRSWRVVCKVQTN